MTKIKICGLNRAVDIECANLLKPDFIGFIFARKSRRFVSYEQANRFRRGLSREVLSVGVYVDSSIDEITNCVAYGFVDWVQLHGSEDNFYIEELRRRVHVPVIKAFNIETSNDIQRANQSKADHIVLDNGSGGTGKAFDWSLIGGIDRPFFLSGGINIENIGKAMSMIKPFCIDVSSGVETNGNKDPEKISKLINAVRFWRT